MTIRNRVILLIITSVVALVLVLYGAASTILLRGFKELEAQNVQENIERAKEAFSNELEGIAVTGTDYAHWTDLWSFARGENESFFDENFYAEGTADLGVNVLGILDLSGQFIRSNAVDLQTYDEIPVPDELAEYLANHPEFLSHQDERDMKSSLIMLPTGAALLFTAPISQSDYSGPIAGTFLLMRFVDETFVENLETLTKLELELLRLDEPLSDDNQEVYEHLLKGDTSFTHVEAAETIEGHALLSDVNDNPLLMLHLTLPRPIYAQASLSSWLSS
jgi:sensor domain CHASE-containing protein